jgi:hypothetical protein
MVIPGDLVWLNETAHPSLTGHAWFRVLATRESCFEGWVFLDGYEVDPGGFLSPEVTVYVNVNELKISERSW